jgi:hypothetical protein
MTIRPATSPSIPASKASSAASFPASPAPETTRNEFFADNSVRTCVNEDSIKFGLFFDNLSNDCGSAESYRGGCAYAEFFF